MWNSASVTNLIFILLQQVISQSTVYLKGEQKEKKEEMTVLDALHLC